MRDESGWLAALGRPFATFGGDPLYNLVFEQPPAIGESIILNHPFVDGSKRTGFALLMFVFDQAGYWVRAPKEEMYQFVIDLATGENRLNEAVEWLRAHCVKR